MTRQKRFTLSSSKGFAHILGLILLLAGLVAAVYLVQTKTNFLPKASELKPAKEEPDYVKDTPLVSGKPIYNYSISGQVSFKKGDSYVRAVLIDDKDNEYLVYEAYPLISDSNSFTVTNVCEETCYLNGVVPKSLRVEGNSSSLNITQTSFSDKLLSSVQVKDIPAKAAAVKTEKDQGKIKKISSAATQKKIKWTAGETSVSKMTYAQKRKLFPGIEGKKLDHLPNLQGFEYYKGGIFEILPGGGGGGPTPTPISEPIPTPTPTTAPDLYPASWDWRNRHGENWMTSVKNQGGCGSCWAFAATGATEAVANLYFNQHLDLNLSEQDALSCSGAGDCVAGGWPGQTLDYYTQTGVVPETCFPYQGTDVSCNKCADWSSQVVKISGRENFDNYNNRSFAWLKEHIIRNGVLSGGIFSWRHAMPLLGWEIDPSDNNPVWIFKNSWGTSWGENGYARLKIALSNIGWTHALQNPVILANDQPQISCVDKDNDGYFNWGIGSKPSTCPVSSRAEEDCDDSSPTLGAYDAHFNCLPIFVCSACSADINRDSQINIKDFSYLSSCFGKSSIDNMSDGKPCLPADINGDGNINITDFSCLRSQYGKQCTASSSAQLKR